MSTQPNDARGPQGSRKPARALSPDSISTNERSAGMAFAPPNLPRWHLKLLCLYACRYGSFHHLHYGIFGLAVIAKRHRFSSVVSCTSSCCLQSYLIHVPALEGILPFRRSLHYNQPCWLPCICLWLQQYGQRNYHSSVRFRITCKYHRRWASKY